MNTVVMVEYKNNGNGRQKEKTCQRSFRDIVDEIRAKHKLSQEAVAVDIGVSIDALRKWLYRGHLPSNISRKKISFFLSMYGYSPLTTEGNMRFFLLQKEEKK